MPDLTPEVFEALKSVHTLVYFTHPGVLTEFPCILFYESGSSVHARAAGSAYLHEIEFTLDIYALTPETTHALSASCDEKMRALGFQRAYCCDLFDEDSRAHRRLLRYRALCSPDGVLTQ